MTDQEITKLCSEAMGFHVFEPSDQSFKPFDPLYNDAHAMALVKAFPDETLDELTCFTNRYPRGFNPGPLFNRVIAQCIARKQAKK